jgi:hypothetical protein
MKWYDIAHAALTLTPLVIVVAFAILLLTGILELRRPSRHAPAGEPIARLIILHGLRPGWEYRLFEGENIRGRADQQPVEMDLQPQEPEDRVWSSRQHAVITGGEDGSLVIEDLNAGNGTYVNRQIVRPGTK